MSSFHEISLSLWSVRKSSLKVLNSLGPYGYFDSARPEEQEGIVHRREIRNHGDLGHATFLAFLQSDIGPAYRRYEHTPSQLGTAVFTALLLYPLSLSSFLLHSGDNPIAKASEAQETSYKGQSVDRDKDSQYNQDGLAQKTHSNTEHSLLQANTRSHNQGGSDRGSPSPERQAAARSFDRYGPLMTAREINEGIKRLLLGDFPATEGYVYGFTHPYDTSFGMSAELTQGIHLIKIGRSVDYERRMREFHRKCKYVPHVIFSHTMSHHLRIELVVHLQLHNERLQDVGCLGCGARHEEWFRVDGEHAESLVSLWQGFANCNPYDDDGVMLPEWCDRLERLDMDDVNCWERFIRGNSPDHAAVAAGYPQELEQSQNSPPEHNIGSSSNEQAQTDTQ